MIFANTVSYKTPILMTTAELKKRKLFAHSLCLIADYCCRTKNNLQSKCDTNKGFSIIREKRFVLLKTLDTPDAQYVKSEIFYNQVSAQNTLKINYIRLQTLPVILLSCTMFLVSQWFYRALLYTQRGLADQQRPLHSSIRQVLHAEGTGEQCGRLFIINCTHLRR